MKVQRGPRLMQAVAAQAQGLTTILKAHTTSNYEWSSRRSLLRVSTTHGRWLPNEFLLSQRALNICIIAVAASATHPLSFTLIKAENSITFKKIATRRLEIWKVDVNIDDDLDQILSGNDPLVRLGLDPEEPLSPETELSKLFPDEPNDEHLHIIVQRPDDDGTQDHDDTDVFNADDIQDVLEEIEFRISFVLFGHPHIAVMTHIVDDSKNGYLKFVPSGRPSREIKILQYLTQIDSARNHTISGAGIWPVHGGHVISMPMAGTWLTKLDEPSEQLWSVAEQLFEAIDFMHQHGVAHMDLKPANILIPLHGGRLSIIDFNTSVRVKGVETMFRGIVGTPGYIAPEVASGRGLYYSAVRADLWSCGKTLYEFCECCQPSADCSVLLEITEQLMGDDPEKRPIMSDVLEMMKKYKASTDTGMNCLRFSSVGSAESSA